MQNRPAKPDDAGDHAPHAAPAGSSELVGDAAADVRPDLAATPQEESERTSDAGSRGRESTSVTVADNAGKTPGADRGEPDTGQEAGSVSEPG